MALPPDVRRLRRKAQAFAALDAFARCYVQIALGDTGLDLETVPLATLKGWIRDTVHYRQRNPDACEASPGAAAQRCYLEID